MLKFLCVCLFISIEKSEWIQIWWKLSKKGKKIRGNSLFALHVFELFECFQSISYMAIDKSTNIWGGQVLITRLSRRFRLSLIGCYFILFICSIHCIFLFSVPLPEKQIFPWPISWELSIVDNIYWENIISTNINKGINAIKWRHFIR